MESKSCLWNPQKFRSFLSIILTDLQTIVIAYKECNEDWGTFYKTYGVVDKQGHYGPDSNFNRTVSRITAARKVINKGHANLARVEFIGLV